MEHLAPLLHAVAWPTVALLIARRHRVELKDLITGVKSVRVTAAGVELDLRTRVAADVQHLADGETQVRVSLDRQLPMVRRYGVELASVDPRTVRACYDALAFEYEAVRATHASGSERTRQMEFVTAQMRALAFVGRSWLPEFSASGSVSQRLAAISILQAAPNPVYISWLEDRAVEDHPFVMHHAIVALRSAVRVYSRSHHAQIKSAVLRFGWALRGRRRDSDRWTALYEVWSALRYEREPLDDLIPCAASGRPRRMPQLPRWAG